MFSDPCLLRGEAVGRVIKVATSSAGNVLPRASVWSINLMCDRIGSRRCCDVLRAVRLAPGPRLRTNGTDQSSCLRVAGGPASSCWRAGAGFRLAGSSTCVRQALFEKVVAVFWNKRPLVALSGVVELPRNLLKRFVE